MFTQPSKKQALMNAKGEAVPTEERPKSATLAFPDLSICGIVLVHNFCQAKSRDDRNQDIGWF